MWIDWRHELYAAMGPMAERERDERRSADVASAHAKVASANAVIPKKAEY